MKREKKEAHQTSSKRYFKSFLFRRRTESKQRRISARRLHKQRMERDNKRENFDFIISRHGIPSIFNSTVYNLLEQINFLPPPTHPPTEARVKGKEKSNWSKTTTILKTHKQIKKSSIPKQNRRKKTRKKSLSTSNKSNFIVGVLTVRKRVKKRKGAGGENWKQTNFSRDFMLLLITLKQTKRRKAQRGKSSLLMKSSGQGSRLLA